METLLDVIKRRHSVRNYTDKSIDVDLLAGLRNMAADINRTADLHLQIIIDDPAAFQHGMARYGKFSGVNNYIALVGRKRGDLSERVGYYGEKLALYAALGGLNFCWVGLTFSRHTGHVKVGPDEKYLAVISLGYGANQGVPHKIKQRSQVMKANQPPQWFIDGVDAALLAPTAMNQQKFTFILHDDDVVEAKAGFGYMSHIDLGIVKYHFEVGAGRPVKWMG